MVTRMRTAAASMLVLLSLVLLAGCPEEESHHGGWVEDENTGLFWQEPPAPDAMEWDQAITYCEDLHAGGFDDWRLPLVQELISMIEGCASRLCEVHDPDCLATEECRTEDCRGCGTNMGFDDGCFWGAPYSGTCDWYWTASAVDGGPYDAWFVYFQSASVDNGAMSIEKQVRCVRGTMF